MKIEFSHFGPTGPRQLGMMIHLHCIGFLIVIWKYYLDVRIK